ncbi:hypothetical protein HOB10_03705 [Candidatus Parcubacteria bacterium]|nr:hypothetical protein [Candidatus Parcubacteria bacterium]
MSGKFVALVGPSGVGKTTIITALMSSSTDFVRMLPHTSRPPRPYEVEGEDYWFVSRDEIQAMLAADPRLKETLVEFDGHQFVIDYNRIEQMLADGKVILMDLYINWVQQFKERYDQQMAAVLLLPDDLDVLVDQLSRSRKHDPEFVDKRMAQTAREMNIFQNKMKPYFNKVIVLPRSLDMAVAQVRRTITLLTDGVGGR